MAKIKAPRIKTSETTMISDIVKHLGKDFTEDGVKEILGTTKYGFSKSGKSIHNGGKSLENIGDEIRQISAGASKVTTGATEQVAEKATEQVVKDISRPPARSKGDKFYTESLNNTKLSDAEIAKFRKEQELYNNTVDKGTKHSPENREFDFTDKRNLDQTISERGKDYNNTDNALQLTLNERMNRPTGDGSYAEKRGKIISQSAFNDSKAMKDYLEKNNVPNITDKDGMKIQATKERLTNKYADQLAEKKAKTEASAKSQETKEKVGGFMNKAIPTAIGGGLIFSMFNSGGQMSNSELYGQSQPYGQRY